MESTLRPRCPRTCSKFELLAYSRLGNETKGLAKVAYAEDLKRKIYFYRVAPATSTKRWKLDRAAIVKAIKGHVGQPSFYLDEGEDRITCAEVHSDKAPQSIKLYGIRRTNLPSRDSGTGTIGDLGLAVTEGLAEAVHLRLFPNGIIGFESFFYGPRIGRSLTASSS
jgi:hypothetical protein